ncbi:MAG: TM2 domain-containing protein [Thermosynechococcus sp.]|uniref:TM2 domain-containing protein n=1 Tax=Thermosynechococcus sp. TaxID=2814275 RepID=UPI0039196C90
MTSNSDISGKKLAAGICGILLGTLGIHKFVLGYNTEGLIMLLVSLLTCGLVAPVMGIIGLIEDIIYLTKSDEEFYRTYIASKKGWF